MFDAQHGGPVLLNMSLTFGITPFMSFGFGAASNFSGDKDKNIMYMNLKFNL